MLNRQSYHAPLARRPLPSKRYAWWKRGIKELTIAAGFVYDGGILLCSDTQQEGGVIKIHAPKVCYFECAYGRIGFAMAGNMRFATSAVQHCKSGLDKISPEETIQKLEEILEREYRRAVLTHPDYGKEDGLPYWLVISLWSRVTKSTSLFFTEGHLMQSCFENFYAIGSGFELANILARPFLFDQADEDDALILAAYVLARVKDCVPGCGGDSQFVAMRNDGSVEPIAQIKLDQIAEVAAAYDKAAHLLLFAMGGDDDTMFSQALDAFGSQARGTRVLWRKLRKLKPPGEPSLPLTIDDP